MSSYRKTMRQALEEMYPPVPASLEEQVVVELDEDVATMAMAVMGLNAAALLPVLFMAVRELIRGTPLESSIKKVVEKLKKNKNYKMSDSEKSDVKGFVSKVKKEKPSLLQKAMKKFKEEVELDEGTKQVLAHGGKGKYKVIKDGDTIEIKFGGKVVGTADFDRGADSFFVSIKGEKGQKSFDDAQAIADYFAKNKITEEDELEKQHEMRMYDMKDAVRKVWEASDREKIENKREKSVKAKPGKTMTGDDISIIKINPEIKD